MPVEHRTHSQSASADGTGVQAAVPKCALPPVSTLYMRTHSLLVHRGCPPAVHTNSPVQSGHRKAPDRRISQALATLTGRVSSPSYNGRCVYPCRIPIRIVTVNSCGVFCTSFQHLFRVPPAAPAVHVAQVCTHSETCALQLRAGYKLTNHTNFWASAHNVQRG